ncbi:MAG: VTT domain-containing protein [Planctomycetaceae bacterium]|nr:VTT domain-containing protein [Planctomycetaceae bacterium]
MRRAHDLRRPLILISLVLLVPIMPFLLLGDSFEAEVQEWVQQEWSTRTRFWMIVLVLSLDILLPIPSSGVSTYAGGKLGFLSGTLASWLGMSLGAVLGFALARWLGRPFALRFGGRDVSAIEGAQLQFGPAVLVFTRALPILAEACVLLMGVLKLPWRNFLPAVLLSNLVISMAYAAFGAYFVERDSLAVAVIASVLLPLGIAILVRKRIRRNSHLTDEQN